MDGKDLRETKTPEMTKDKIDTLGIICSFNDYLLSNHYALLGSVLDTRSQSNTKRWLGSWIMLLTHQYYLAAVLGALSPALWALQEWERAAPVTQGQVSVIGGKAHPAPERKAVKKQ